MRELYHGCYAEKLDNGITVIVEPIADRPLALGVWVRVGSRDEPAELAGIAHFIEHMVFKGTTNRTAFQISEEVDAMGGYINAMTHKEYTLFHIDVLPKHLEAALDILSDLVKNPRFAAEDIRKEQGVVLEEIRMTEDNPQEKVFDLFVERIWDHQHPMARPILGRADTVRRFHRAGVLHFHAYYHPEHVVVTAAGAVEPAQVLQAVQNSFSPLERGAALSPRQPPQPNQHCYIEDRDSQQANLVLGVPSVGRHDERRFALEVMNTILGGGMSSRLFKKIREELGLAYAVFSSASLFEDSGIFIIYVGTDPKNARQTVEIGLAEIDRLVREPVPEAELRLAKEKLKGNMLLGLETSHSRMIRLGIGELYNIHAPVEELVTKIERVTSEEIQEIAHDLFGRDGLSLSAVGPEEQLRNLGNVLAAAKTS
jgi:predicted Zn-dependent peptidase